MGLEFYVLNHVLYLIISPPVDNGPGGALEQRQTKGNPSEGLPRCEAILMVSSAGSTATRPKGEGAYARCCGPCIAAS